MKHAGGRPTKYDENVVGQLQDYFETTGREQTELPTVEGFAEYINVNVDTINNWCDAMEEYTDEENKVQTRRRHPEFFSAIKELMDKQRRQLMNDGLYGGKEVNSTMAIFLLKVNHGMVETEKKILANDVDHPLIKLDTK